MTPKVELLKGKLYEYWIFILLLVKSKRYEKYKCDIGKEVKIGDKFDDCVIRYEEDNKQKHIFCQAKYFDEKGVVQAITEDFLLGGKSTYKGADFDLKKYFQSFLRIKNALFGTIKQQLDKVIIHTNLPKFDVNYKIEVKQEKDGIREIFNGTTSTSKTFRIKYEEHLPIVQYLLSLKSDFDQLVECLIPYVNGKKASMKMMSFDDPLLNHFRIALFNERILEGFETSKKTTSGEKRIYNCKFHQDFIHNRPNLSKNAKSLRRALGIDNHSKNELLEIQWKCCKGFYDIPEDIPEEEKKQRILPENKNISLEDVEDFLTKLEFNIGQPNLEELLVEVGKETNQEYHFNEDNLIITKLAEDIISNWRNRKPEDEDWILDVEKNQFFHYLASEINKIEVIALSRKYFEEFHNYIDKYGICFEQYVDGLQEFFKNDRHYACFIESNEIFLTTLKIASFIREDNDITPLFVKDKQLSKEHGDKVFNIFKNSKVFNSIIIVCKENFNNEKIHEMIRTAESLNKHLIVIGGENVRQEMRNITKIHLNDDKLVNLDDMKNKELVLKSKILWQKKEMCLDEVINEVSVLNQTLSPSDLTTLIKTNGNLKHGEELIKQNKD